jgi:N-acetylglucosamine kinase-like BadF-type ATPase
MAETIRNKKNGVKITPELYVGVDGGGTKTLAVLTDADLNVLGEGKTGASNPLRVGVEPAVDNILTAIDLACDVAGKTRSDVFAAQFGLAGVRREDIRKRMRDLLSSRLRLKNLDVVTDAEIALYGATNGGAGLVVIAGTGSICCGRNDEGTIAMAGGWGPLAGDEGGGAGIARRALQAVAKATDGRGQKTKLSEYATDYFRAARPEDIAVAIYAPSMTNDRIAGFAKFVIQAARDSGDQVALKLLDEAGCELGLAANAVVGKLGLMSEKFPVAYVGGVFAAKELIFDPLIRKVHETAPAAFLAPPQLAPPIAAAKMASKRRET